MLVPIFYTIFYLLLGTYLYVRSPNENSQRIFIFQKHLKNMYMGGQRFTFSLLGGYKINQFYFLPNYYISLFLAGIITYVVLSRLTNYKVFLKERSYVSKKALWLRTYQQSKYVVWLFWLVSFYSLSYKYYMTSIQQQHFLNDNKKNGTMYIIITLI